MKSNNYRVRMRSNQWYVDELSGSVHIVGYGPYETIGEAQSVANATGLPDGDKGDGSTRTRTVPG